MSRSGYIEDLEQWYFIRYRGRVASATRGRRGQALFRDLVAALDAMPEKRLIADSLMGADGAVCALGAVSLRRGVDVVGVDPDDADTVAAKFDIATPLAREVVWENDEGGPWEETPEARWTRMRHWAASQLKE